MKKLIFSALLALSFLNVDAKVTYARSNGFLWHYDYVQQTNFNNGDIVMACNGPGWQRCKPIPVAITYHGTDTPISDDDYTNIDNYITSSVSETKTSGTFIFNSTFYVTYDYDVKSDVLTTTLYVLEEARDLHLIN